jgi:valyl-tRNA synthetase
MDTTFDEKMLKVGKRLVTKIYNAGKFVLSQQGERHPPRDELDLAFIARLAECVEKATAALENYDYARALSETEGFFWSSFTDAYIELAKNRAKGASRAADGDARPGGEGAARGTGTQATPGGDEGSGSAIASLRLALNVMLRLFAPFLPFVTEEVWSWIFAAETGWKTIHRAPWPGPKDFEGIDAPKISGTFDAAVACLSGIHRLKTRSQVSIGSELPGIKATGNAMTLKALRPALADVRAAARAFRIDLEEDDRLPDLMIEVNSVESAAG